MREDLIERLRYQPTMSQFANNDDMIAALLADRQEAADALKEAREDSERLDWMANNAVIVWGSRDRGGYELPYLYITSGREGCDPCDLRTALDEARGDGDA